MANRRRNGYSKPSLPKFRAPSGRTLIIAGAAVAAVALAVLLIVLLSRGGDNRTAPIVRLETTESSELAADNTPAATDTAAEEAVFAEATEGSDDVSESAADDTELPSEGENTAGEAEETVEETLLTLDDVDIPEATVQPSTGNSGKRSVHFRIAGDIMFHIEQLAQAKKSDGSYDFHSQFRFIADSLANADYTIANLETTVGKYKNSSYSGYPQFNTPESCLEALKDCGIDFFTMANNHMLDRWFEGMQQDVNLVEKYGFGHVGAYRTKEERNTPVIVTINGIKFGFVAYTHTTNTMENYCDDDVFEYGVPFLYKADIKSDIKALRDAGAEVVIALPHWGAEYVYEPDETQIKYAKKLAKAGADIIIGSHSHMVQKMQVVEGKDSSGQKKQVFLIYSMGNFISTMTAKRTDGGIILDFTVTEQDDGTFKVENIGYVPVYVWKMNGKYTVVPIGKFAKNRPEQMSDSEYSRMLECYNEIKGILGTNGFTILPE